MALFRKNLDSGTNNLTKHGRWPLRFRKFDLVSEFELTPREQPELFFVMGGKGVHASESGKGSQAISAGTAVVLAPGTSAKIAQPHHFQLVGLRFLPEWLADSGSVLFSNPDTISLWASMFWFNLESGRSRESGKPHVFHLDEREQISVAADLQEIETCLGEGEGTEPGVLEKLSLLRILVHVATQYGRFWREEKRLRWDSRMPDLLDLFERVAARGLRMNVSQAEDLSGMPGDAIDRCFQDGIGMGPMPYLERRRAHYAAQLVLTSNLSDAEIVDLTGFQKTSKMDDEMKRVFGRTTTTYRADFCR